MTISDPVPGLIVGFSFLWSQEAALGLIDEFAGSWRFERPLRRGDQQGQSGIFSGQVAAGGLANECPGHVVDARSEREGR